MRILTASDRALLVEFDDLDEAIRASVAWRTLAEVDELVPGARTVLVRFMPHRITATDLADVLTSGGVPEVAAASVRRVEIGVHYDGDDLAEVAGLLGVSINELVHRHLAAQWRVAFAGFAPGFGYLVGSDPLFRVPRRTSPRTRVPAGSVALAGEFTGVYPRTSPGGWQLIGHTDTVMWDLDRDPPALLTPATTVSFVPAERPRITIEAPMTRSSAPVTGPRIEVVSTVFPLLVQDRGRVGLADVGVSASGVADRMAAADAQRAVGNPPDAAVVETLGGAVLRFVDLIGDEVAVATGAEVELTLTDLTGRRLPVEIGVPFALSSGDVLRLGHPSRGLRCYLAVRGGLLVEPVLGSVATDILAGVGPAPLVSGSVVGLGGGRADLTTVDPVAMPRHLPGAGDEVALRLTLGPRDDWFTPASLTALTAQPWTITSGSDRVGLRLSGDQPMERVITEELPSEGAVTGALQVPPDGQPVLFGPDHPLTGGYPIVAAVIDADLDLAAQLPPGAIVRFHVEGPR